MEKKANIVSLLASPNNETTNGIFLKDRNWYHLYITTNEEIKEGDWFFVNSTKTIHHCLGSVRTGDGRTLNNMSIKGVKECYKIIATTDESLSTRIIDTLEGKVEVYRSFKLSQPSQSFIEVFVREYNKGHIITEVMVEYELDAQYDYMDKFMLDQIELSHHYNLKINPKDNTITIKKVKTVGIEKK